MLSYIFISREILTVSQVTVCVLDWSKSMHQCVFVCVYVCVCECVCVYIYIYIYIYMCVCVCVCLREWMSGYSGEWVSECENKWVSKWIDGWVSEWVSEGLYYLASTRSHLRRIMMDLLPIGQTYKHRYSNPDLTFLDT